VADINGDGKPDLLVPNYYGHSVSVLLGNGTGGFAHAANSPISVSSSSYPQDIAVGDVNGDGKADVIVAQYARASSSLSHAVLVLNGDGAGGFGTPVPVDVGAREPQNVAWKDVNADNHGDLIVSCTGDDGHGTVAVLLGDGAGGLSQAAGSPIDVWGDYRPGRGLAVGDVNGDGKPDVLIRCIYPNNVAVLLGNGSGGFTRTGPGILEDPYLIRFAVADVNGDGKADALGVNYDEGTLSVALANGSGGFTPTAGTRFSTGVEYPTALAVADVNGDGKPDAVVVHAYGAVSFMLGDGAGGFAPRDAGPMEALGYAGRVTAADVNADHRADVLVVSRQEAKVGILLNTTLDTTPPSVTMRPVGTTGASNGLAYVPVLLTDSGSGVRRAELTSICRNVHLEYPLGTPVSSPLVLPEAVGSVCVYGVKNTNTTSRIEVKATDAAGNVAIGDPIIASLEIKKGRVLTRTFKGIPQAERYVNLQNGTPGLTRAALWINGKIVSSGSLASGQTLSLDVNRWLKPGDTNTARIVATGLTGANAVLSVADTQTSAVGAGAATLPPDGLRQNVEFSR
jgi:hypothetical protein